MVTAQALEGSSTATPVEPDKNSFLFWGAFFSLNYISLYAIFFSLLLSLDSVELHTVAAKAERLA